MNKNIKLLKAPNAVAGQSSFLRSARVKIPTRSRAISVEAQWGIAATKTNSPPVP
jgi:hypothetical protein